MLRPRRKDPSNNPTCEGMTLPITLTHSGETRGCGNGTFTKLEGGMQFKVSGFKLSVQCITASCPSEDVEGTVGEQAHGRAADKIARVMGPVIARVMGPPRKAAAWQAHHTALGTLRTRPCQLQRCT